MRYLTNYQEIDQYTYAFQCINLNFNYFRIYFTGGLIRIDTLLPIQYHSNIGTVYYLKGKFKNSWTFGPYENPPIYTEQIVSSLVSRNIEMENFDKISTNLNQNRKIKSFIDKYLYAIRFTETDVLKRRKVHSQINSPIKITNDENGMRIQISSYFLSASRTSALGLIAMLLNEIVSSIKSLGLPKIQLLDESIDRLIRVYSSWESIGSGEKLERAQIITREPSNKICPNCGASIELGAKFCSECAFRLKF